MRKTLNNYFERVEVDYTMKDKALFSLKGIVRLQNIDFSTSINYKERTEKDANKPIYTGTVSVISPMNNAVLQSELKRREYESKGKAYTDKDLYATKKFACNSINKADIASKLHQYCEKLISENSAQLNDYLLKTLQPSLINPEFAAKNYANKYLSLIYLNDKIDDKLRVILRYFPQLGSKPLCRLTKKDIELFLSSTKITSNNIIILSKFWDYLINQQRLPGKNRLAELDLSSGDSLVLIKKRAFTPQSLTSDVFKRLFKIINDKESGYNVCASLYASGFSMDQVESFKWNDIEFIDGYDDFAVAHIDRAELLITKHDFSRPSIPDTAKYLSKVFKKLCRKYSKDKVLSSNLASDYENDFSPLERKEIKDMVQNIIVRAGFRDRVTVPGRNSNGESISIRILQKNYESMLINSAGLASDPDTLAFLLGRIHRSSTYTNYESHTSPDAQYRLYTILKSLSIEEKIKAMESNTGTFYATPATNHEVVSAVGTIVLKPGERIVIRVPHGVTGYVDFV